MKRNTTFPWIKSYPAGIRWDAELPTLPVSQLLDDAAEKWPGNAAIDFMGRRFTYGELQDLVNRAAKGFQALGVKPGVHVGLYLPNTPHYVISFLGVLRAGGTVVNYSPLDAERVLEHKVDDSETDIIVTLDLKLLYPQMDRLLGTTRLKKLVIGGIGEMSGNPEAVHAHMLKAGDLAPTTDDADHVPFARLLDNDGKYKSYPISDVDNTIAVLQYTGGTTGLPKGAMLTHANLTTAVSQLCAITGGENRVLEEGSERVLAVLPLFHIYALTVNMLFGIRMGAELVLHTRFDIDTVVRDLAAKKITIFPGVPTMYTAIINYPGIENHDLSALKFCGSGGAPLPVEVNQRFQHLTGCCLVEGWGMTETSPTGTFTPVYGMQKVGSCGMPTVGVTLKFVDVDDPSVEVPRGERGEMCIKGPNVMKGYWKNPDATAASMTKDGFFRTGDVAWMDEDGFVFIVDRTKDMILCGGYNVYPRVIEEAIYEHPSVSEVTVIGVHDDYRGESPKAFIVLKPGAAPFTLEELKTFLKRRLGKHEMVQAMDIRAQLPRTPVGKLSKKELYDEEAQKRNIA
ncbi:long-chain-fatty-acid--CoA ligase [Noviherbaspirillum denitrificans]|uniref:Long-chain-fatty-acid--CoA ligase n=1 Tax=Noviherbaspirillum denitrificans TaxID=1968433 RepID=A0A254TPK9_9BURK|nr:long-chain fatty acid--CoA ligase [Noviherbaspirillum denitrificans]OWW22573.1 dicarboxylate--CoA ligase PimA [Noviherbaspirillum denitrificans]